MNILKKGFAYYVLATLFTGMLLMLYIVGDPLTELLDVIGWAFFLTSCVTHAAILMLALFLVFFLPWALLRLPRIAAGLFVGSAGLLAMLVFVNMQVYRLYRFHINGFILNMLTGSRPGDIFEFDTMLYFKEGAILAAILAIAVALWFAAARIASRASRRHALMAGGTLLVLLLFSTGCHIYGSFVVKPSIVRSVRVLPYYFPLSASSFLDDCGFERTVQEVEGLEYTGDICYPLRALQVEPAGQQPNIVVILLDSWSKRTVTAECMPNIWQFANEEQWYTDHVSCSNGTGYAVFGLFMGVQPYYWAAFTGSHVSPLLVDRLLEAGYDFRTYPSATLDDPPLARAVFQHVPGLRMDTEGRTALERDTRIKDDLVGDLPRLRQGQQPFFAFIFFDQLHAIGLPKELTTRFQPSWEYVDYSRLHNDMDPAPFWNLYRNSAYQTDRSVGEVLQALKANGLWDNTLVFITGDHAQEFNENHKNYWGHSSNFSNAQLGVPFMVHIPGQQARRYTHRTTHYDLVPTLMHDYLGVQNALADYTCGRLLNDTTPRLWHFAGNDLRYAFLVEGDTILTKEGAGYIEVTDAHLNPVEDYHINAKAFDKAVKELNRFYK